MVNKDIHIRYWQSQRESLGLPGLRIPNDFLSKRVTMSMFLHVVSSVCTIQCTIIGIWSRSVTILLSCKVSLLQSFIYLYFTKNMVVSDRLEETNKQTTKQIHR